MSLGQLRNFQQLVAAFNGHENRHGARVRYGCDDKTLSEHPERVLEFFVESGGAKAFAEVHGEASEYKEPEYYI